MSSTARRASYARIPPITSFTKRAISLSITSCAQSKVTPDSIIRRP